MHPHACPAAIAPGRAGSRRSKVMEAARKLFADHGFHNTGMAQLAAASDVKVGQIYRDFECKEAIVAAIVEADFARFFNTDALRTAIEQGDRAGVSAAIMRLFDRHDTDRMMPEILAEASRNPRIHAIIEALDLRFRTSLVAAVRVLAPGDALRERRLDLAELLLTLVVGACQRTLAQPSLDHEAIVAPIRALIAREIADLSNAAARGAR